MPSMDSFSKIQNHMPGYKHHWIYVDHGIPVMTVARYDTSKNKTYRQFILEDNEWVEGMPPSPYPLFGLNSLKNNSPFKSLFITEGEKCASILHQIGWPSISTALGAQNPGSSDWNPIRYYSRFIILRDNDKAGISFSRQVSSEIMRVKHNAEIFVVNLAPEISGGDLVDWLQSTVLRGQNWDGFKQIPQNMAEAIQVACENEIGENLIKVEDCQEVDYKPIEAHFKNAPQKFTIDLKPVPEFPTHIFPEKISHFLKQTSEQFSQVTDFAATTLIASVGGLIGRSVHLRMRRCDTWYETANCWAILVGPPSAKKSPIMRRIFCLFKELKKQAAEEFAVSSKNYKNKKREAEQSKEEFDDPPPIRRRYITDDVTTPKLRELMSGNPRGIILRNDELKGQLERLDKIGNEGDRSFYMSCWSGLEEYNEDRMCRDSLINIPLALTWIGCIPPTAIRRYLLQAMNHGSGADGFMQRFQFICFPDQKKFFELSKEPVSKEIEIEMQKIWKKLDDDAKDLNRILNFSEEAQTLFNDWLIKHENNTRSGSHPTYWESHLGKQAKVLAVLIIILHCLDETISEKIQEEVQPETIQKALEALSYYEAHAQRCYESITGGLVADAEIILALLREKRLPEKFKAQDIYHQGLGGLSDSVRVRSALEMLSDYSWLIPEKIAGNTGRKAEFWILHPRAFKKD